jgi:hypothetical protein
MCNIFCGGRQRGGFFSLRERCMCINSFFAFACVYVREPPANEPSETLLVVYLYL